MKPQTGVGHGRTKMLVTVLHLMCRTVSFLLQMIVFEQEYLMDYLQICAKAFEHLLDIKYHIIMAEKEG